jgi:hypothetical protein
MELRQNMRRATTRPMAWVAAILVGAALVLGASYALPTNTFIHPTSVRTAPATGAASLLDREAERQPAAPATGAASLLDREAEREPASRNGGPGSQVGDAP